MLKKLELLFWTCLAVLMVAVVAIGIKEASRDRSPQAVSEASINMEDENPPCKNARNESVDFAPNQHGEFAKYKISGLTFLVSDDRHVDFDYGEFLKAPVEFRDFILRAACARSILGTGTSPDGPHRPPKWFWLRIALP